MKMKLMVSHPSNSRTKVGMVKVGGCTLFRRGSAEMVDDVEVKKTAWEHAPKCKRLDHYVWSIQITIGQCTLIRSGGKWTHKDKICDRASRYHEQESKAAEAREAIKTEPNEMKKAELIKTVEQFEQTRKPVCLMTDSDVPATVAGCEFALAEDGNAFHHVGIRRCKHHQPEHFESTDARQIRLTRAPGWKRDEFVKTVNAAMAKVVIPANPHSHIAVEVS